MILSSGKQRTESRQTMGNGGNCSFYLTPSSGGMQTPNILQILKHQKEDEQT